MLEHTVSSFKTQPLAQDLYASGLEADTTEENLCFTGMDKDVNKGN